MSSDRSRPLGPPQDLQSIGRAAIAAVSPEIALRRKLHIEGRALTLGGRRIRIPEGGRIHVLAVGKAATAMARAADVLLGDLRGRGLVITKLGHSEPLAGFAVLESTHPVPDARSLAAGARVSAFLTELPIGEPVLVLLSGGASALMAQLPANIRTEDLAELTSLLLRSGADIREINTIRKHVDALKGGGLARFLSNREVACLALSDVVGDAIDVIGSGPLAPDPSTFAQAILVWEKRIGLTNGPQNILDHLREGCAGRRSETPKPGDGLFEKVTNQIVASGRDALEAAAAASLQIGFKPLVLTSTLTGEAREAGGFVASVAREILDLGRPAPPPVCLLWGGETTVTVRGHGRGGRNQEVAAALAQALSGRAGWRALCFGTDGTDGPTDAAGAWVDGSTELRALESGLSIRAALESNDTYSLLERIGALFVTGPTGTHVNDIGILLIEETVRNRELS
ncbi:MAG: DUF4147 domain-containing protein [Planctomycetes bacterium]|nr:DUF4147 domain-containing protein [Planctomycetota bacterium]